MILLWHVSQNTAQIQTDIPDVLFLGSYSSCLLEESLTATINFQGGLCEQHFIKCVLCFLSINDCALLKFIEERTNLRCVY